MAGSIAVIGFWKNDFQARFNAALSNVRMYGLMNGWSDVWKNGFGYLFYS